MRAVAVLQPVEKIPLCEEVSMYGRHFQQSMDQPGMDANPARGQLNRENDEFLVLIRA